MPSKLDDITADPDVWKNIAQTGMTVQGALGHLSVSHTQTEKWLDKGEKDTNQGKQSAERRFFEMVLRAESAFEDQQLRTYHEKVAENKAPAAAQALDSLQLRLPALWRRKALSAEVAENESYEQAMAKIRQQRSLT